MKLLDHYSVPYLGLSSGQHEFDFVVDDDFFRVFENTEVNKGAVRIHLSLEKRPDMGEALLSFNGEISTNCDRCLGNLVLPVERSEKLLIKYGENKSDEEEVMYISQETSMINFAQVIYEYILLSIPMVKSHDEINDCDHSVIEKMNENNNGSDDQNSIWSGLKDLDFN